MWLFILDTNPSLEVSRGFKNALGRHPKASIFAHIFVYTLILDDPLNYVNQKIFPFLPITKHGAQMRPDAISLCYLCCTVLINMPQYHMCHKNMGLLCFQINPTGPLKVLILWDNKMASRAKKVRERWKNSFPTFFFSFFLFSSFPL